MEDQSSFPNGGGNSGKVTIWSDGGTLKFTAGSDTEQFATKASVDAITGSGSGSSVNVDSANKIKVTGTNTGTKNILFATGADGNQQVLYDSNSLTYDAASNTLTTTNFSGDVTGALTGNADTATKIASITNSDIVQLTATQTLTNKTLTSPTITGTGAIAGTFTGGLTGNVTGNADTCLL